MVNQDKDQDQDQAKSRHVPDSAASAEGQAPPDSVNEVRQDDPAAAGNGGEQREDDPGSRERETLLLELQDAQDKSEEYWNELLKARAELSNYQKRAERDVQNAYKYSLENFASELLPVLDSLELGLDAAAETGRPDPEKLREGMELTLKLLRTAIKKFGIEAIDPQGERFNPELHQAMSMQPAPAGVAPNTVLTVYQKGYLLNDRLIRPAMVVVAGPESEGKDEKMERGDEDSRPESSGGHVDEMA